MFMMQLGAFTFGILLFLPSAIDALRAIHMGVPALFDPFPQVGTLPANVISSLKTYNVTKPTYGVIHCNCHGSTYDPFRGAGIITHPTQRPLPFVTLKYDDLTDTLYAKKLTGPVVFGHPSDLTGGHAISNLSKTTVNKLASS